MDDDNNQNSPEVEIADSPKRTFNVPTSEATINQKGAFDKSSGNKLKWLVLGVVILLMAGGAFYFLRSRSSEKGNSIPESTFTETEVNPTPEPSPTPSATPAFDRSKYTLRVLNGTETSGLAASVSAKLKGLGYKIEKTGNASNSAQTKVSVKPSLSELLSTLIKDLSSDFKAVEGQTLKTNDSADGEIILGPK